MLPCIEQCQNDWQSRRSFTVSFDDVVRDARLTAAERKQYWVPFARKSLQPFRRLDGLVEPRTSVGPTPGVSTRAKDFHDPGTAGAGAPYHPPSAASPTKKDPLRPRTPSPLPRGSSAVAATPEDRSKPGHSKEPPRSRPPMPARPAPEGRPPPRSPSRRDAALEGQPSKSPALRAESASIPVRSPTDVMGTARPHRPGSVDVAEPRRRPPERPDLEQRARESWPDHRGRSGIPKKPPPPILPGASTSSTCGLVRTYPFVQGGEIADVDNLGVLTPTTSVTPRLSPRRPLPPPPP